MKRCLNGLRSEPNNKLLKENKEVNDKRRRRRQERVLSIQVSLRTGAILTSGRGSLLCLRSHGAVPATSSRHTRSCSGAGMNCTPGPFLSPSSRAAERNSISRGGGCGGPSSGTASATGHLAPGSFHPCRGKINECKKRKHGGPWEEERGSGTR